MEKTDSYLAFLNIWHEAMWYLFLAAAVVSLLTLVIYWMKLSSTSSMHEKYDVVSRLETKTYLRANYILATGIFFFLNTVYDETVELSIVWFFIRIFISLCIGTLHVYIAFLIFQYYYPAPLNKRLKKFRHTPRINPNTGNVMKLLSEDEEDSYLDEGMQAEEDAFSVDYDVWIDEQTGDTHIEKYQGHLNALECDRCGFQTLKLQKEEVLSEPTGTTDGEIEKSYKCSYCGRVQRKTQRLSSNIQKDVKAGAKFHINPRNEIASIHVEVRSTIGGNKVFEFQNIDQAKSFLEEFDYSKLRD